VHSNIGRAFAKLIWEELRGFSGDRVARVGEGCNWCEYSEQGCDCVWDGVMKFAFVLGLAGEEVITILVRAVPQIHFVLMRAGGRIGRQR
jgi:hypothetical protein